MNRHPAHSANPLIAKVQQLFSRDLALENDYLRPENKILRSKVTFHVLFFLHLGSRRVWVAF